MTREQISKAVRDLFTNGRGDKATRLVLVQEPGTTARVSGARDLGGLCEQAVVDRLCELLGLGVKP